MNGFACSLLIGLLVSLCTGVGRAQMGERRPMQLPTPFTVDGEPILGTYSVASLEELALVKEVGMNLILGGHEDLDPDIPRGRFCRENGIRVMHHLTQHLYGKPRLGDAIGAGDTTLPLLEQVGENIPASGIIQIEEELIYYGRRTPHTLAECQRGFRGTQPAPHREGIILFWPQACEEEVRRVKDSPNLWGYYVLDDSPGDALSALRAMYRAIRRAEGDGPHRPVCAGYGSAGSLVNLAPGVCDLMLIYWYPVSNAGYNRGMTSHQVQWMLTAARARVPGIPFVGVYQAFNGGTERVAVPTSAQLREQLEDFIREGACGLIAFLCQGREPLLGWAAHPHLQEVLKDVHRELKETGALTISLQPEEMRRDRIQPIGSWETPLQIPGVVPAWYVIAPFDDAAKERLEAVFPPEQGIDLQAVYPGRTGNVRWYRRLSHGGVVGLGELFGHHIEDVIAYAACTVTSPRQQKVQVRIGSDDDALLWLNGGEVWRHTGIRGLERDNDIVEATLPAGESTILMKICNRAGMWGFFLRFTDLAGRPLQGLTFSPEAWAP